MDKEEQRYLLKSIGVLMITLFVLFFYMHGNDEDIELYNRNSRILVIVTDKDTTLPDLRISNGKFVKNKHYDIIEFNNSDWNSIVEVITQNYNMYDSFIIVHPEEQLVYTASALSFMLENLNKPVIVIHKDIHHALKIANYRIPEVVICDKNRILRACRTKKTLFGYTCPTYPVLGYNNKLNRRLLLDFPKEPFKPLFVDKNKNVVVIKLFPTIDDNYIKNIVKTNRVNAIILETYGDGYIPDRRILALINELINKHGIIVVNISQDSKNTVNTSLDKLGVICGGNLTTECAFAKLCVILSNLPKHDVKIIRQLMSLNMRGEL
jgi:L-asparaginase